MRISLQRLWLQLPSCLARSLLLKAACVWLPRSKYGSVRLRLFSEEDLSRGGAGGAAAETDETGIDPPQTGNVHLHRSAKPELFWGLLTLIERLLQAFQRWRTTHLFLYSTLIKMASADGFITPLKDCFLFNKGINVRMSRVVRGRPQTGDHLCFIRLHFWKSQVFVPVDFGSTNGKLTLFWNIFSKLDAQWVIHQVCMLQILSFSGMCDLFCV